ncbi:response regulator [Bradyrhizobium sp. CB82]|uniref:response regulator n=1 Tax=Bradyrhizobium sp. CB82 TaxID=3039159 RepID=UPI0024B0D8CE|nr:response regulator [Bradyrhizobium sp. CB82]WFU43561.1 response regulator [Bradyrhizobium sp. CB82]
MKHYVGTFSPVDVVLTAGTISRGGNMAHPMKGCRVLIVEDEYLVGDDLANALRSLGAHVIGPISQLAEALAIHQDSFDVAVLDINLRGETSYLLADELMRIGKPFIFTTGYCADMIPHRFQDARRWEKPWQLEDVTTDIARMCSQLQPPVAA